MKCLNCGAELPDGAKFCGNCGSAVTVASAPAEEVIVTAQETVVPTETPAEAEVTPETTPEKAPSKVKLAMAAAGVKLKALAEKAKPVVDRCKPFVEKNKLWIACGACAVVLLLTILIVVSALTAGNGFIAYEHSIQLLPAEDELMLKLQYFGHLMGKPDSEKSLRLEKTEGRGRRGDNRGRDGWMASPS